MRIQLGEADERPNRSRLREWVAAFKCCMLSSYQGSTKTEISMSRSKTLSFRTDEKTEKRLTELAEATGLPKSRHIGEAVREYLSLDAWRVGEIRKGLEDAEAGRLVDHHDVEKWIGSWDKDGEGEMPGGPKTAC